MDDSLRQRIDEIFSAALELPGAARAAFLDSSCAGDAPIRREVERLLRAAESDDEFLAPGAALESALRHGLLATRIDGPPPPTRIGPYRIGGEIGRGGMSVVYLGERDDGAFQHRVAVKLVKPGADCLEVLERFEQERQILASLNHPAIARLFDGGSTESGHPYFVMELVEGRSIDAWCEHHGASIEQRLALFVQVCEAVAHAHKRNIVHRDIKPSNILVSDDGQVKLLDFGIAKLLDPEALPHAAPATRLALRPLTPEFASPEQVSGGPVTAASDVYQLGVLLYLLLTGKLPYRLEQEGTEALARAICDQPALPPSTFVTQRYSDGEPAQARETSTAELRKLGRRLRGDLDTIVLVALRKTPARRYPGAAALAADLKRHLAGEPIEARGDSLWYRARRRLRRHAAAVVTATAVVLAAVALGHGWLRGPASVTPAEASEVLAVLPIVNVSGHAEDEAFCDGLTEELIDQLAAGGLPVIARSSSFAFKGESRTASELAGLLGASYLLEGSLRRDGERVRVSAKLVDARGRQLWQEQFERDLAGIFTVQDEIVAAVVANVAPTLGWASSPQPPPTANLEAYLHYRRGRDLERRRPSGWSRPAMEAYRQAIDLDPDFAPAWAGFAVATRLSAQWATQPEQEIRRAQEAVDRALALDPELAEAHAAQGLMYSMDLLQPGASTAAEASLRRALALNPRLIQAYNWLSAVLTQQQRFAEADEMQRAALAVDPVNPLLLLNVAQIDSRHGRYDAAKRNMVAVLRLPQPPSWTWQWLAGLEAGVGRYDEALAWLEQGVERLPAPDRYNTLASGAHYYARLGLSEEAWRVVARAEAGLQRPLDPQHMQLKFGEGDFAALEQAMLRELATRQIDIAKAPAWLRQHLAFAHVLNGSYEAGIAILEDMLGGNYTRWSGTQVDADDAVHYLAFAYRQTGRDDEADRVLQAFRDAFEVERQLGAARNSGSLFSLARTEALLGHDEVALDLLKEAVDAGWRDYYGIRLDPRWDALRGAPAFAALMARVQADLDTQRERVRASLPLLASLPP